MKNLICLILSVGLYAVALCQPKEKDYPVHVLKANSDASDSLFLNRFLIISPNTSAFTSSGKKFFLKKGDIVKARNIYTGEYKTFSGNWIQFSDINGKAIEENYAFVLMNAARNIEAEEQFKEKQSWRRGEEVRQNHYSSEVESRTPWFERNWYWLFGGLLLLVVGVMFQTGGSQFFTFGGYQMPTNTSNDGYTSDGYGNFSSSKRSYKRKRSEILTTGGVVSGNRTGMNSFTDEHGGEWTKDKSGKWNEKK